MADDELKLRRQADRAVKAKALMENELLIEGFDTIERELLLKWRNSQPADAAGREKLFGLIWATDRLRAHMAAIIEDGRVAAHILSKDNKGKAA